MMCTDQEAQVYRIRIKGLLDSSWSAWLGGTAILPQPDEETLLCASLAGQAALHALLEKLRDVGLPLISVECVSDGQAAREAGAEQTSDGQGRKDFS
jgi:hypothetical protein